MRLFDSEYGRRYRALRISKQMTVADERRLLKAARAAAAERVTERMKAP